MSPRTDLIPAAEIARLAGVSRQRGHVIAASEGFPSPAVASSIGKLWRREDVEKWLATWPRRAGRRTKPEEELSPRTIQNRRYRAKKRRAANA